MWSALENMALRESLPTPLQTGDTIHDILISGQLEQGRYHLHHLGHRRSKPYLLKQYYSLNNDAFLRWQNETRFIGLPQTPGYIWPVEEWRGGLISPYPGGSTLDQWLRTLERPLTSRLCLAARLGQRIKALHNADIAHRRLSPHSVRIVQQDVVLTDFGHACHSGWDDFWTDSPRIAADKTCASPDLLSGMDCGYAEDIHALGALLHLILAGKPAFGLVKQFLRSFIPNNIAPTPLSLGEATPAPIRELAAACMEENQFHRPLITEASDILTQYCENAGHDIKPIIIPETEQPGQREKVMVFIKDDPKAISLFDRVLERSETTPSLFLFIGLIPNDLPSGHMERFKGSLFRKIGQGLSRCRSAGLLWSLRSIENTIPEVAARNLIQEYSPDCILIGRTNHPTGRLLTRKGFAAHLEGIDVPIEGVN